LPIPGFGIEKMGRDPGIRDPGIENPISYTSSAEIKRTCISLSYQDI